MHTRQENFNVNVCFHMFWMNIKWICKFIKKNGNYILFIELLIWKEHNFCTILEKKLIFTNTCTGFHIGPEHVSICLKKYENICYHLSCEIYWGWTFVSAWHFLPIIPFSTFKQCVVAIEYSTASLFFHVFINWKKVSQNLKM